jgi:hypothetical protein
MRTDAHSSRNGKTANGQNVGIFDFDHLENTDNKFQFGVTPAPNWFPLLLEDHCFEV